MITGIIDEKEIRKAVTATPLKPKKYIATGVSVQVKIIHIIISFSTTLILPIAFNMFVIGLEMAPHPILSVNKINDGTAASHLWNLGINCTAGITKILMPTMSGKISNAIKNNVFWSDLASNSFCFWRRENKGKVTAITFWTVKLYGYIDHVFDH